jgi:hypothetical protein
MASAIPTRDAEYDAYLFNWKTILTATPALYGMLAADATAISAQYTAWHNAYVAASNLLTRTRSTVATKDSQKILSLSLLREQYGIIKANPAVLDANKVAIGVRVTDPVPTPIPAPTTNPVMAIIPSGTLQQLVNMVDVTTPTTRAKPAGVTGALIVRKILAATAPIPEPEACTLLGFYSRTPFYVTEFTPTDSGKIAYYYARWTNAKGEEGPWSPVASAMVA